MNNYQKIAVIIVRGFAVSFLVSTMIEIGIIASDTLFVKAGVFYHSEISFRPRLMFLAFYFLGSLFLFSQSQPIAKVLVQGLTDEDEDLETKKETVDDLTEDK